MLDGEDFSMVLVVFAVWCGGETLGDVDGSGWFCGDGCGVCKHGMTSGTKIGIHLQASMAS